MGIGTLLLMKQRIATELARPDFLYTDQRIADAITDAINTYQTSKFRFSELNPASPPTFSTVFNQVVYSATNTTPPQPVISNLFYINYLTYTDGTSLFYVRRVTPLEVRMANQNQNVFGPPEAFAYEGESILLTPIPDRAYLLTIDAHMFVAAPASDTEAGNRWMSDGEMLIRSRAKFELATNVTRNKDMAMAMSPEATGGPNGGPGATYRAWSNLKSEQSRLLSKGRVRPMIF